MSWEGLSEAERNAAYDSAGATADLARIKAEREAASATYRTAHPSGLDLPYGSAPRQRWDLFPAADPGSPCLVFIHGGYWQMNSRESFAWLAQGVAAHGWSAALPSHTLAPEATVTDIGGEIARALDWLDAHGPDHGVAGPVILSGWSAGGQLTAMCLDHPVVMAGLAISGIFDLAPLRDTWLNDKLKLDDGQIARSSPRRLTPSSKPLAVAYGTAELPAIIGQSLDFHAHRRRHDAPGELVAVDGANHFTILDTLAAPDGALTRLAMMLATAGP